MYQATKKRIVDDFMSEIIQALSGVISLEYQGEKPSQPRILSQTKVFMKSEDKAVFSDIYKLKEFIISRHTHTYTHLFILKYYSVLDILPSEQHG